MRITGVIPVSCTVTSAGSSAVDIDVAFEPDGTLRIPLEVDCNVPIQGTLYAEHGQLINEDEPADRGGYVHRIGYRVSARFEDGSGIEADGEELVSAASIELPADVVFNGSGEIVISWRSEAPLAGRFADQLLLTITPNE